MWLSVVVFALAFFLTATETLAGSSTLRGGHDQQDQSSFGEPHTQQVHRELKGGGGGGKAKKAKKVKKVQPTMKVSQKVESTEKVEKKVHEEGINAKVAQQVQKISGNNEKNGNDKNNKNKGGNNNKNKQKNTSVNLDGLGIQMRAGTCGLKSSDGLSQRPSVVNKVTEYGLVDERLRIYAYPEENCCNASNDCESCCCYPAQQFHPNPNFVGNTASPTNRRFIKYQGYCIDSDGTLTGRATNAYAQQNCLGMVFPDEAAVVASGGN